jgi:hypothetical protein
MPNIVKQRCDHSSVRLSALLSHVRTLQHMFTLGYRLTVLFVAKRFEQPGQFFIDSRRGQSIV